MASNAFRVDLKIKERQGSHPVTIDEHKNITPEKAIVILDSKYVCRSKELSKLAKAIDDNVAAVSDDINRLTGGLVGKKRRE